MQKIFLDILSIFDTWQGLYFLVFVLLPHSLPQWRGRSLIEWRWWSKMERTIKYPHLQIWTTTTNTTLECQKIPKKCYKEVKCLPLLWLGHTPNIYFFDHVIEWYGFPNPYAFVSDPSPFIALPCPSLLQSVRAFVETWLVWPLRLNIHATSPKVTQPILAWQQQR